jgi:hypothetical protein
MPAVSARGPETVGSNPTPAAKTKTGERHRSPSVFRANNLLVQGVTL